MNMKRIPTLRAAEEYGQAGSPTRELTGFGFERATLLSQKDFGILTETAVFNQHLHYCVYQQTGCPLFNKMHICHVGIDTHL